jgi:hypothetical protein
MIATFRRCLIALGVTAAVTALWSLNPEPAGAGPDSAAASATGPTTLDGFTLQYLPDGLGPSISDFDYEWEEVAFHSRVWERGPDAEGNHSVDLQVGVLRGDRLTDPEALRDFLAEYLEQDPQEWELRPYARGEYRGFVAPGRVFFLVQPGVAVQASADGSVVDSTELLAIADGVEPAAPTRSTPA